MVRRDCGLDVLGGCWTFFFFFCCGGGCGGCGGCGDGWAAAAVWWVLNRSAINFRRRRGRRGSSSSLVGAGRTQPNPQGFAVPGHQDTHTRPPSALTSTLGFAGAQGRVPQRDACCVSLLLRFFSWVSESHRFIKPAAAARVS